MSYEFERDVTLEYGGESEAGVSCGSRTFTELPRFTEAEIRAELGDAAVDSIRNIFATLTSSRGT